jgi:hypothetical protein
VEPGTGFGYTRGEWNRLRCVYEKGSPADAGLPFCSLPWPADCQAMFIAFQPVPIWTRVPWPPTPLPG